MSEISHTARQEIPVSKPSKKRQLIGDRGNHLLDRIEGETGANISACYQCERCTNACPAS